MIWLIFASLMLAVRVCWAQPDPADPQQYQQWQQQRQENEAQEQFRDDQRQRWLDEDIRRQDEETRTRTWGLDRRGDDD
jgi:hypothetical protein